MALTGGTGLVPFAKKSVLSTNYIDFTSADADSANWAQQYIPEVYEAEVERFGNRTIGGFLKMVGAEIPMTSDQVVWSEQNRLHVSYTGLTLTNLGALAALPANNVIGVGQTILVIKSDGSASAKAYVSAVTNGTTVAIKGYSNSVAELFALVGATGVKIFVYGSEYKKGTDTTAVSIEPSFTQFSNKPIIIKDKYEVSGSDASQIGWVEVTTEGGDSGYLWYLKGEGETRLRFEDYLEMAVVEGEKKSGNGDTPSGIDGTEGLFAAVSGRGQVDSAFAGSLSSFDAILKGLDKEGAIEENMLFLNRTTALAFDDMLAGINGGNAGAGSAYGIFDNDQQMALNLGFSGFRRGSYDFYKTDWKYLNDASTRGIATDASVNGILIPAGTSTVYDQSLGKNIRRPFLHVRYRASEADDRRMKSWLTGSVGGAATSSLDAMEVHFLSERCLCVQGANNFVLFT
tara:strand:- start:1193 stop:2569 length:1377 start_codon:yes stop_codon:yes gene_type:complete